MAYAPTTDFSVKDGLASGDTNKIIRGSEFDTEFTNIAADLAAKANLASPTFTGTPAAPTASGGTNTTQIATTAFVQSAVSAISSGVTSVAAGTDITVTGTGSGPYTGAVTVATGANVAKLSGSQDFTGAKTFSGGATFSNTANFTNYAIFNPTNASSKNVVVGRSSDPSSGSWNMFVQGQGTHPAGVFQGQGSGGQSLLCITGEGAFTYVDFVYGAVGTATYTSTGSITTNGTTTYFNESSDYRLKENVADMTGSIARVKQLNPVNFTWINNPSLGTIDGFLAHEVQAVVPNAVVGEKDAVNANGSIKAQGIDQSKLVPLLTAALQEAIARIETLESKVAALESQ